ncbi:MAG: VacJ family lipoprotein [Holosporales bacterium]|nr:VacJ family lipoprotein [Holosporales bacterium]
MSTAFKDIDSVFLTFLCLISCSRNTKKVDLSDIRNTANIVPNDRNANKKGSSVSPVLTNSWTNQNASIGDNNEDGKDEEDKEDVDDSELDSMLIPMVDYAKADPLEKMNRVLYEVHRVVDLLFIRPLALIYGKVLPKPARTGVSNFVSNLTAPLRVLCRLLQGNINEAGKTAGKFVTNTVLGCGGLFDVASRLNIKEAQTSFTETFKKWGIEPGPYIIVPGIGPTTFRGAIGFLFDSFADPVFLLSLNKNLPYNSKHELTWASSGVQVTSMLIMRSQIDQIYDSIEKGAGNRYSKLRGLVLQQPINK